MALMCHLPSSLLTFWEKKILDEQNPDFQWKHYRVAVASVRMSQEFCLSDLYKTIRNDSIVLFFPHGSGIPTREQTEESLSAKSICRALTRTD